MYRFRTIILETPFIKGGYEELQSEVDRLVADALEKNGNCQLVNVQVTQLGDSNAPSGIYTILLYTVEILAGTEVPQETTEGV